MKTSRRFLSVILGVVFSMGSAGLGSPAVAADAAPVPQWIWSPETDANSAPVARCCFRKVIELGDIESGRVEITCDNAYRLFVNGLAIGTGDNWMQLDLHEVKDRLVRGKNAIAIVATNSGGPAGLVVRMTFKEKGREPRVVVSDDTWKTSPGEAARWREADFDDAGWKSARVFGPLGKTAPWGSPAKTAPAPVTLEFTARPRPEGKFQLLDGDRVIFVGDTLIERAQTSEYIETRLSSLYPERNILFRNLGWSGDTVFGEARAGFGTVADGFAQLKQQVYGLKPTVIVVGYGANSAFEGETGLPKFVDGFRTLLDVLAVTKAEIILLSPLPQERLGPPLPDPEPQNANIRLYRDAIARIAEERGLRFVDLVERLGESGISPSARPLTDNGIHLTPYGYWHAARVLEEALELPRSEWKVVLDTKTQQVRASGTTLTKLQTEAGTLRFELRDELLPVAAPPRPLLPLHVKVPVPSDPAMTVRAAGERRTLQVAGLPAGRYVLKIDGQPVVTATAAEWAAGVTLAGGPEFTQTEGLRRAIVTKNQLYFHRWRPQNQTYLFGFRKHEQGNNAAEIPEFDPLVEDAEAKIAELRRPVPHRYELTTVAD